MNLKKLKKFCIAFIKLSRLKVILKDYFWALTIISIIAAGFKINIITLLLASLISLLVQAYAFIINDCEDAEDDAMDPRKAQRNPVSSGFITSKQGILILQFTSFPAAILAFLISGIPGFLLILLALIAGHMYSWKRIRLKSLPFIDLVSHAFMLSMYSPIFFLLLPQSTISIGSILIVYGLGFFSAGGALYNQLRDYEVDQKSGLNNTTNLLRYDRSRFLAMSLYSIGVLLCGFGVLERILTL